ncbi:uncharacterized protein FOMMEDRAFT_138552 [Fomitiporia mediterranea MF3/22]|uniref:uncharacterized protein n=1 Tax=Fomitiporia mediterranea (strain MF3/22) TaxID=694068 RepID=UPI00044098B3|nr:uncharacterized protein FOMMEDRAFT_138552 [Fomitiporia mediterranea MF3/22]EJD06695.1 hypothetical protein FOMMEDRAFT_138552 [Fomitiporia mediterranea MF3/22]
MAPCKPSKSIKIRVPRHNAQRLGPSLTSTVRKVANREKTLVQLMPPVQEQPGSSGVPLENASEWNSLLLSARAQRGPFWDMSTQQFLVEKESDLYYDPSPLLEATRAIQQQLNPSVAGGSSQQQHQRQALAHSHQQQPRQVTLTNQQFPYATNAGTPIMGHATPNRGGGMTYGNHTPGSAQGQYFGDVGTPTRPGAAGMMAVNGTPVGTPDMYGRRITRGMADGFPGYAG